MPSGASGADGLLQGRPIAMQVGEGVGQHFLKLHAPALAIAPHDGGVDLAGPPRGQGEGGGQEVARRQLGCAMVADAFEIEPLEGEVADPPEKRLPLRGRRIGPYGDGAADAGAVI